MPADRGDDSPIIDSWKRNATPWIRAVRNGEIESRRLATDQAILDAVLAFTPRRVLDLGCGEGWLALALTAHGADVCAIDVVPELVDAARAAGVRDARLLSYEAIADGELDERFDALVCNFSLFGKDSVEGLLWAAPRLLAPGGRLIVQTLHPLVACGDAPYEDGWRMGSWAGFSDDFRDAPPWYFRTLTGWIDALGAAGLTLDTLREPLDPRTGKPASLILIGREKG